MIYYARSFLYFEVTSMKTTLCIVLSSVCALAFSVFAETTYVVENRPGYNAWPVITTLGDRLVISYSRGKAHNCSEGCRDAIVRTSTDGARTWTPEHVFVGNPDICEGAEGSGHDSNGALLFWLRCWGRSSVTHELYRSSDAVHFKRISVPKFDPFPIQVMDVVPVSGLGLISLWFGGDYSAERGHSWGYLLSKDDGQTWSQITVERDLPKSEWPTEQSLVYIGGGRLLAVARVENVAGGCLGQLYSEDFGHTWRRTKTSITDVLESTPALLYDADEEILTLYYFQRGAGLMKRRTAKLSAAVADSMTAWSPPRVVAYGRKIRPYDSGNVKAVRYKGSDYLAYYAGDERDVSVLVSVVGRGETAPESLEGRRVLFLGDPDRAAVSEFARTNRCEALVYPTRTEAYRHHPNGAFAREFSTSF